MEPRYHTMRKFRPCGEEPKSLVLNLAELPADSQHQLASHMSGAILETEPLAGS